MRNFIIWFSIIGKHLLKNPLIPVFVVLIPIICAVSTIYHKMTFKVPTAPVYISMAMIMYQGS